MHIYPNSGVQKEFHNSSSKNHYGLGPLFALIRCASKLAALLSIIFTLFDNMLCLRQIYVSAVEALDEGGEEVEEEVGMG